MIIRCIQYRLDVDMALLCLKNSLIRAFDLALLLRIESHGLFNLPPELGLAALTLPLPVEMQLGAIKRTILVLRRRISLAKVTLIPL